MENLKQKLLIATLPAIALISGCTREWSMAVEGPKLRMSTQTAFFKKGDLRATTDTVLLTEQGEPYNNSSVNNALWKHYQKQIK